MTLIITCQWEVFIGIFFQKLHKILNLKPTSFQIQTVLTIGENVLTHWGKVLMLVLAGKVLICLLDVYQITHPFWSGAFGLGYPLRGGLLPCTSSYFGECCRRVDPDLYSAPLLCLFFLFFFGAGDSPCGLLASFSRFLLSPCPRCSRLLLVISPPLCCIPYT